MIKATPLLLVLMALSASKPAIIDPQTRYFCDVAIRPYEVGQALVFSYSYRSFQTESAAITVSLTCGAFNNVVIYTRPAALVKLVVTDTVTVPGGFMPAKTATLKFSATGSGFTSSKLLNLTATSHSVIDIASLQNGTYVATGKTAVLSSEGGSQYYSETLTFSGFYSLYQTHAYHRLTLPDLTLSYTNSFQALTAASLEAEFYLEDPKNLFPNLPFDDAYQSRHLNAQLAKSSDGIFHFAFTDRLYVDPHTLMMSLYPSPGFTETSFVYFPKNHFSELKTLSGRLKVPAFGMNGLSIDFRFSHEASFAFFGDCASAAYCVTVDDDSFDIGYDNTTEMDTHA